MKKIFILCVLVIKLFAIENINKLPLETVNLIDSFNCFDERDKSVLYTYALNNEYMISNDTNKTIITGNITRHMTIFHEVLEVTSKCDISFYKYIGESMTLTPERHKAFKNANKIMNRGPSSNVTNEDKKNVSKEIDLFDKRIDTFKQTDSGIYLDLLSLKTNKDSIPKRTMAFIKSINNITDKERNLLFSYANNVEQRIKNYDNPNVRKKLIQEMTLLDACLQNTGYKLEDSLKTFVKEYPGRNLSYSTARVPQSFIELYSTLTPLRKEISKIIELNYRYNQKNLSPKELEDTCGKLKPPKLSVFDQGFKEKKKPEYATAKVINYISKNYKNDKTKKRLKRYVNLTYLISKHETASFSYGLEHYQLESCIEDTISSSQFKDFNELLDRSLKKDKLYTSYKNNLDRGATWWVTTLALKSLENGSDAIFNTYGCKGLETTEAKMKKLKNTKPSGISDATIKRIIYEKYIATYLNETDKDINNKIALEKGILFPAWIKNDKVSSKAGGEIVLSNTKDKGLSLTFKDYPNKELCISLIYSDSVKKVFYGNVSYKGANIIIINQKEFSLNSLNYQTIQDECNQFEKADISFIKTTKIEPIEYGKL